MGNEVWVVEHSGKNAEDWYVWSSTPHTSKSEAVAAKQELESSPNGAILNFRVTRYVPALSAPEPEGEVEGG